MTLADAVETLLGEPHHDGSYVETPDELGDEAVVRLRVPRPAAVERAFVRYVVDGQPRAAVAELDGESEGESWWVARFAVENPAVNYRWLLSADGAYRWLNGLGTFSHDVGDADDFVVGVGREGPDWHLRSVVYEIFPDRFARSGCVVEPPDWAIARRWNDLPTGRGPETQFEWFGGDLAGIEQRLDHVESLGASLIYLTPIFPAGTTHRYDATTFDRIDPLLGGDEALASLTAAARARGIRVFGDLTLNHVGAGHEWFRRAREDAVSPEREFFYFDESLPHGYASWSGVPTLPKLDQRSPELRRRLDGIVARWCGEPFDLDGWRVDAANVVGRHRDIDVNHEVARATRAALERAKPDGVLVAEHMYDARADLRARGWHGVMNYAGCLMPVWSWLREGPLEDEFYEVVAAERGGEDVVAAMQLFRAGVPWPAVLHSWPVLSSHDTPRLANAVPSRERRVVAVGMQMTMPGVPMVWAGDEIGLEGEWGEDGRRTMPWDGRGSWDEALLDEYKRLIALRRAHPALARGGIRYAFAGDDAIAYMREARGERLLCLASRSDGVPNRLPLDQLGCEGLETLYGGDATVAGGEAVLPDGGPAFHIWKLI